MDSKEQVLRGYFPGLAEAIAARREMLGYKKEPLGSHLHTFMDHTPNSACLAMYHIEKGRIFGNEPTQATQLPPLVPTDRRSHLLRTSVYLTALGFEDTHRVIKTLRRTYYTDFVYPHPEKD